MATVRNVANKGGVTGLVFKKLAKEEDPNVPGAPGVYMAVVAVSLTPSALAAGPSVAEQTFTPAELADLDPGDQVDVSGPAPTANTAVISARCSATGTLKVTFLATTGTPTPAAGTYVVAVTRVG